MRSHLREEEHIGQDSRLGGDVAVGGVAGDIVGLDNLLCQQGEEVRRVADICSCFRKASVSSCMYVRRLSAVKDEMRKVNETV